MQTQTQEQKVRADRNSRWISTAFRVAGHDWDYPCGHVESGWVSPVSLGTLNRTCWKAWIIKTKFPFPYCFGSLVDQNLRNRARVRVRPLDSNATSVSQEAPKAQGAILAACLQRRWAHLSSSSSWWTEKKEATTVESCSWRWPMGKVMERQYKFHVTNENEWLSRGDLKSHRPQRGFGFSFSDTARLMLASHQQETVCTMNFKFCIPPFKRFLWIVLSACWSTNLLKAFHLAWLGDKDQFHLWQKQSHQTFATFKRRYRLKMFPKQPFLLHF